MAKRVAKKVVASYARRTVELKFFSTNASLSIDVGGGLFNLSVVPQGDTDQTRDGDMLYCKGLSFNYACYPSETNVMRVIIFRWNVSNALASPTPSSVLDNVGFVNSPLANYVQDQRRQRLFTILYDKIHGINLDNPTVVRHKYIKLRSRIAFDAATTAGKGHIFLLVVSDSGAVPHPSFNFGSKLMFTDA